MSVSVFGQNALEKDLGESFKQFDLVELDEKVVLEKAKSKQPIEIQAYGREFEFVLTAHDLRAANYKAIESIDSGERALERGEVETYKGKLKNDPDSEVRFTVTESGFEGLIYTGDSRKFFVTKAQKFSKHALRSDAVVYSEHDLVKTVDLSHDTANLPGDIEGKLNLGVELVREKVSGVAAASEFSEAAEATNLKTVEVATEADYQWVIQAGNATAANNEILGILNLVDGIYKRDLNLSISVTYQHAWSTSDPYPSSSMQATLDSFLNYWNSNYPSSQYPRDTAHLFTGKFSYQGIAYGGIICRYPSYAYGLTGRSGNISHFITAHEIGHNLGAEHVDNSGSCANSIMNPSLSSSATSFCATSKTQIANYTTSYGSCLSSSGSTPTCTYSISSASQSFSTSGGTGSVSVSTQSGCSWAVGLSNQNFVSLISSSNGTGSGLVSFYVAQNTSTSFRSATLTIAGQYFTVQQAGVTPSGTTKTRFDFDGDGKADVSVFRPSTVSWYTTRSSDNSFNGVSFGQQGDLMAPADFDGDGRTDISVFRPSNGTWYYLKSSTGQFTGIKFGQYGDLPIPADFDGDGLADISVFRPSNGSWYRLNSSTGQFVGVHFGQNGDIPITGDFDGDIKSDIAVFRPSNGAWFILRSSSNSFYGVSFGLPGDIPTAADFDGDRRTDIAVYRPSAGTWYRLNSSSGSFFGQQFGIQEDKPTAADFDGDGRADIAVFRPSTGSWYLQRSSTGYTGIQFGKTGDIPAPTVLMSY
ncbi:MAG: FG-GAP-like repeat-containing protein [Acidobacteriota bacterium]|nr:FG-GAP-like repeat-containing protein [Acidobacteriota bacterium]